MELVCKYFSRILLKLYVITTDIFKNFKFPVPKIACINSFPTLITTPYLDWPIHHLEQGNEVGSQSQSAQEYYVNQEPSESQLMCYFTALFFPY